MIAHVNIKIFADAQQRKPEMRSEEHRTLDTSVKPGMDLSVKSFTDKGSHFPCSMCWPLWNHESHLNSQICLLLEKISSFLESTKSCIPRKRLEELHAKLKKKGIYFPHEFC